MIGTLLTTQQEVEALASRSIVVLTNLPNKDDAQWWTETVIYQNFDGHWLEMDPTDRDDGVYSVRSKDILVIAERDGYNAYVVFNPEVYKHKEAA